MKKPAPQRPGGGRLLLGVFLAAEVLALSACLGGSRTPVQGAPTGGTVAVVPPTAPTYGDSLVDPVVVRSVGGVLDATLDVSMNTLPVQRGDSTHHLPLRSYTLTATTDPSYGPGDPRLNTPRFPGPTFRVRPGDLVRIKLRNNLPPSYPNDVCQPYRAASPTAVPRDTFQDCFHGPNHTNIHYHGMHVTPDSTSTVVGDDVLMVIAPGDSIQYSFRIPQNQSPGTHWYHPHKHGSVAIQVANGMAGAFIVEGGALDALTDSLDIEEHLVAIQQVDTTLGLFHGPKNTLLDKVPPLVNGQYSPVIYMAPGEVQRWRIVNENVTRNTKTVEISFQDQPGQEPTIFDIARDGVQLAPGNYGKDTPDAFLNLAPGQRLDVFIQAPQTAGVHSFRIRHVPGASRRTRDPAIPLQTSLTSQPAAAADAFQVLTVVVDSNRTAPGTTLPATLPQLPEFLSGDLAGAADTAVIVFTDTLAQAPTQFYLGSAVDPYQRFNDTVVFVPSTAQGKPLPMVLDSTQTWKIVNRSQQQINHPFHIHINPFQVDSVYAPMGTRDPYYAFYQQLNTASRNRSPIWLDVLPLPVPSLDTVVTAGDTAFYVKDPGYVFITQRYDPFKGCPDGNCGPPTGEFVMHCHILGHEERGMMQVLEITGDGNVSAVRRAGPGHGPHHVAPPGQGQPQGTPQRRRVPVRKDPPQQHHH